MSRVSEKAFVKRAVSITANFARTEKAESGERRVFRDFDVDRQWPHATKGQELRRSESAQIEGIIVHMQEFKVGMRG